MPVNCLILVILLDVSSCSAIVSVKFKLIVHVLNKIVVECGFIHGLRDKLLLVDDDTGQAGVADDVLADAADHCALEGTETARPNHNHVRLLLLRHAT